MFDGCRWNGNLINENPYTFVFYYEGNTVNVSSEYENDVFPGFGEIFAAEPENFGSFDISGLNQVCLDNCASSLRRWVEGSDFRPCKVHEFLLRIWTGGLATACWLLKTLKSRRKLSKQNGHGDTLWPAS